MTRIPDRMRAMVLERPGEPVRLRELPTPTAGTGEILLRVAACGVCRTDLHIADGELTEPKLPLILGHEIVGRVVEIGEGVKGFSRGDRVGVPWLSWTDGTCRYCSRGMENLCENARFTGYTVDGGFAEYAVPDSHYAFRIPGSKGMGVKSSFLVFLRLVNPFGDHSDEGFGGRSGGTYRISLPDRLVSGRML